MGDDETTIDYIRSSVLGILTDIEDRQGRLDELADFLAAYDVASFAQTILEWGEALSTAAVESTGASSLETMSAKVQRLIAADVTAVEQARASAAEGPTGDSTVDKSAELRCLCDDKDDNDMFEIDDIAGERKNNRQLVQVLQAAERAAMAANMMQRSGGTRRQMRLRKRRGQKQRERHKNGAKVMRSGVVVVACEGGLDCSACLPTSARGWCSERIVSIR